MRIRAMIAVMFAAVLLTGCDVLAENLSIVPGNAPLGAPGDTTALDANTLIDIRCTVCHTRERIDGKRATGADHAAWTATIDRMIGYGAQLNTQERDALIAYLAGGAPADVAVTPVFLDGTALVEQRCTVCHTRARIDAEDGDWEDWAEIVDEMIGYGAQFTPDERLRVIDYLAATHGDHSDGDDSGGHSGRDGEDDDRNDDRDDDDHD